MNIFSLMTWFHDNRKKIRILSHIVILITMVNTVVAMITGRFAQYPDFFIGALILQLITFALIQYQFREND